MARVKIINGRQDGDLIGGSFTNSASQTVFNLGSFSVESNFTGRRLRDYSNELTSFATPITLETLNLSMKDSETLLNFTNNVELNLDYSDIKKFTRFGSAGQIMRVSLRNIIDKYPASLYANNQIGIGGNETAIDYIFDNIQNISTFRIPTSFVDNKFDLIFDRGNTATPNDNELKNLNISFNKYVIWRRTSSDDFSHEIVGFTGDTSSNPFITVKARGEVFNNITGSTVNQTYHLRPKVIEYNRFLTSLSKFERYILNNRLEDNSEFNFIIKNPNISETGAIVYDDEIFTWTTLDGYNPNIDTGLFNIFSDSLIAIGEKYDEVKTDLVARLLTPDSLRVFDTTQEGKITKLLRIYGREFDQIKTFIDSLVNINKTSYKKTDNIPDRLVKNLANTMGWDVFSITEERDIVNAFFSNEIIQSNDNLLPAEIDIELWRRILINTNYYWKSKGTRNAIKSIFRLIGIPEPFINITEYVYTVDGKINPNTVTLQLEDLQTASLPYDNQGFPIAPIENNEFFFQLSGNTDGGQAYINLYRNLGFRVNRVVDNKKSWVEDGRIDRVHYSSPNYYQADSKLIINTKEVDATLDSARGIEYDVYCYNKDVDDPITSSAVTRPYIYVNVQLDINDPFIFSLPDQPLSGSTVLMSFNGITLAPPTGATTTGTEYDYYYDRNNNQVVLNPNIPASASTSRDVISVSYISQDFYSSLNGGTVTGYTSVNYVIERPVVTSSGAILLLPSGNTQPKGDIQLIVDGKTMTKGTSLFTGDFILDKTDSGQTKIIVQNTSLKAYLNSGGIVRSVYIYDNGTTNATKKSEAHRVDSLNSSKLFFNGGINRNVYVMNYAAFDINSIKITVNGITLTNGRDFTLNQANKRQIYLPAGIKFGDIIGAYYIIDDGSIVPPLLPADDTFPDIQDISFLEYLELIQRRLINARTRKTVTDNKGGYYPTVKSLYDNYIKRSFLAGNDPLLSNGYTVKNLYPFLNQYNSFFQRFVDQLLPATIILRKSGVLIRNTSFTKQKFRYPRGVNFDPNLQWLGTDGSEFIRTLPSREFSWSSDFECTNNNAKRYLLNINETTPSGITTTGYTTTLSILNSFSGTNVNGNFLYQAITLVDFVSLTEIQFNVRLSDFLIYANVSTQQEINQLTIDATFNDASCITTTTTTTTTVNPCDSLSITATGNTLGGDIGIDFTISGGQAPYLLKIIFVNDSSVALLNVPNAGTGVYNGVINLNENTLYILEVTDTNQCVKTVNVLTPTTTTTTIPPCIQPSDIDKDNVIILDDGGNDALFFPLLPSSTFNVNTITGVELTCFSISGCIDPSVVQFNVNNSSTPRTILVIYDSPLQSNGSYQVTFITTSGLCNINIQMDGTGEIPTII